MKHNLILIFFMIFFLIPISYAPSSFAAENERLDRLEAELKKLKEDNEALKERIGRPGEFQKRTESGERSAGQSSEADKRALEEDINLVKSEAEETTDKILSSLIDLSGYGDVEYRQTDEDGVGSGFRIHHLSLFLLKDISESWRFFSEIEFEDAPRIESSVATDTVSTSQGRIIIEQMYIEYKHSLDLHFTAGRFITPAGYWNIYHYKPYVVTQSKPMMIDRFFPKFSDGLQFRKTFPVAGSQLDSNLYFVNGSGNSGRMDRNENLAVGARVNYRADIFNGVEAGVSFYDEKDNSSIRKRSYGVHMKINVSWFELLTEYADRLNDPDGLENFNETSLYVQPKLDLGKKWVVAARYDWYDPNDSLQDNDIHKYTGAVNYRFARNVTGKFEYTRNDFANSTLNDYDEFITSIVIAIGDI